MKRFICSSLLLVLGASASHIMHSMTEGTRHTNKTAVGRPWRWGPEDCAELFRSQAGTCIIRTNCKGVDIDTFDFAFDCDSGGEVQRHSFGMGGFDEEDEFDTSVKCAKCTPPGAVTAENQEPKAHHAHHEISVEKVSVDKDPSAPVVHMHQQEVAVVGAKLSSTSETHRVEPKSHAHHEVVVVGVKLSSAGQAELKAQATKKNAAKIQSTSKTKDDEKKDDEKKDDEKKDDEKKDDEKKDDEEPPAKKDDEKSPANVTKFGPGDCVSTWRDEKTGTCIVQTACGGQNTEDHMFGLICKKGEGPGSLVRHTFGKDSFAEKETFDTLITCDECHSMGYVKEDPPEKPLYEMVKDLASVVGAVKTGMKDLKSDVAELNAKVFSGADEKKDTKAEDAKSDDAKKDEDTKEEDAKSDDAKKDEAAAAAAAASPAAAAAASPAAAAAPAAASASLVTVQNPAQLRGQLQKKQQEDEDDDDN